MAINVAMLAPSSFASSEQRPKQGRQWQRYASDERIHRPLRMIGWPRLRWRFSPRSPEARRRSQFTLSHQARRREATSSTRSNHRPPSPLLRDVAEWRRPIFRLELPNGHPEEVVAHEQTGRHGNLGWHEWPDHECSHGTAARQRVRRIRAKGLWVGGIRGHDDL